MNNLSDSYCQGIHLYIGEVNVCTNLNHLWQQVCFLWACKASLYHLFALSKVNCGTINSKDDSTLWSVKISACGAAKFLWTEKVELRRLKVFTAYGKVNDIDFTLGSCDTEATEKYSCSGEESLCPTTPSLSDWAKLAGLSSTGGVVVPPSFFCSGLDFKIMPQAKSSIVV